LKRRLRLWHALQRADSNQLGEKRPVFGLATPLGLHPRIVEI
jgi:hypothetical protein